MGRRPLARAIGVTAGAIQHWEEGRAEPTQENLRLFCEVIGISLQVFWGPLPERPKEARP
jgi:transcriptional regulator with XRE-family HTH domain